MPEAILVAIPNGNPYGSDRLREYLPDGDTLTAFGNTHHGAAEAYAASWVFFSKVSAIILRSRMI